jgi:hypothetical protein
MPLKKIVFKPGVNRENTRYTNEGGWYDCDKVRFRYGTPEKIGGWTQLSTNTFLGVCRAMWPWTTFGGATYLGVGTNLKYYLMYGGAYNDITPIRYVSSPLPNDPFTGNGTTTVQVYDPAHGAQNGDFVTFSGVTGTYASILNAEFQITYIDIDNYYITTSSVVAVGATGGAAVVADYQVNTGAAIQTPITGWGGGPWGSGGWGVGTPTSQPLRVWNNQNFGEDLLYGPQGGEIYYWDASAGLGNRGTALTAEPGASDVPTSHNLLIVSDTSRFVLAFGCPDYGSVSLDPMLIRWSDQESAVNWTPAATTQAGSVRLSHGSEIQAVLQVRQEILVWTDTSLYSLQYLGPPIVWGTQLLTDNISIVSDRACAVAAGVTYWMGDSKFYMYDGRTQTLPCDVREYVFRDFNIDQTQQIFAATVEQFNEVWWFYCSANSNTIDKYVIYNYLEKIWYYGTLSRTAWIDAGLISNYPISASNNRLIYQEFQVDDNETGTPAPIVSYITSSEFDIDDGHNFGFVWRVLPDLTFRGSTTGSPRAELSLFPLQNSGSGYTRGVTPVTSTTQDMSVAGTNSLPVVRVATVPIEQFTGQVNIRVRGRQMSMKIASDELGVQWQLGAPRLDIRPDGRKS